VNRIKPHALLIGLGVAIAAIVLALDATGFLAVTDVRLQDRLLESRPASDDIVIVAIDDKSIQAFGVWPWPRSLHAQMIDALSAAGAKVIGYDVTFSEASDPTEDQALADAIARSDRRIILSREGDLLPLPIFYDSERVFPADTGIVTDSDGVVRRTETCNDGGECQTFGGAIATRIRIGTLRIPYVGPPGSFTTVSFSDVLDGSVPRSTFADKYVLIGATAPDLHDTHLTPTSGGTEMSGVEIHANEVQAILEGRSLATLPPLVRAIALLALAAALVVLSIFLRLRYLVFATAGLLVAHVLSALAFASIGMLVPMAAPLLLIVALGGVDIIARYAREKLQRRFIHQAFAHYLSPKVIDQLVRGEHKLELGGVKKELSILFSDIRGFTTLSEQTPPEQLVPFLNEYLTAMTDIVLESDGVLDKYIGDAVMAFWGAPVDQPDHAVRAATVALRMKRRLEELHGEWKRAGKPIINIGIGINTGEVIVGNMGSRQRFDYTVIGDAVNLAARLESQTKEQGVTIIVSETTRAKLGDAFVVRALGDVTVKGKHQPVNIYELVDMAT